MTLPGDDFKYLRPQATITLSIDRKYNVPLIDIRFDGWYENSVRLWPKHSEQREHFLLLEKTPLQTPSITSSSDNGFDTVFSYKNGLPVHSRERLPTVAPHILGPNSRVDLQHAILFITNEEFELRINAMCFRFLENTSVFKIYM